MTVLWGFLLNNIFFIFLIFLFSFWIYLFIYLFIYFLIGSDEPPYRSMRKQLKDNPLKNAVNWFFQPGWYPLTTCVFAEVHVMFRKLTFWKQARQSFKEKKYSCVGCYSKKFCVAKFNIYLFFIHWNKI